MPKSRSRKTMKRKPMKRNKGGKPMKRKTMKRNKGGNTIKCCVCEKDMGEKEEMFTPIQCLKKNFGNAHRICSSCWWDPNTGFALETSDHNCPGCEKNMPLTYFSKIPDKDEVVDLTES
jgi:hypothetical protein